MPPGSRLRYRDRVRAVLDTDVMVAAFRSARGASRRCLEAALTGRLRPVMSTPLVLEYEAVLTRPEQLAASGITAEAVGEALDGLLAVAIPVSLYFSWRPSLRDADDEMVLATAVNGRADVLATFNLGDLEASAARFGVRAVRPSELIRLLEKGDA